MIVKKREKIDMDNNNNKNSGNNFFSGFLLGVLVGAAVVFLLGTKKGKRLLKTISEEGVDNISNILEEASSSEELDEIEEKPPFAKAPHSAEASRGKSEGQGEFAIKEKTFEKPKVRRFFRGISRHVN